MYSTVCTISYLYRHYFCRSFLYKSCVPIKFIFAVVYQLPWPLLVGEIRYSRLWSTSQLSDHTVSSAVTPAGLSTNPWVTMWCVCGCSVACDVCCVCECYKGGIVVMDVFWRRLCVSMIYLFWIGYGCDESGGKYLFRAANVWWKCAQYFVIASCG